MACCGLCRPKIKSPTKTKKNITTQKINTIDTWMENIEGPYEPISLPMKSPPKPQKITNKEEIVEAKTNEQWSHPETSAESSEISQDDSVGFGA